MAQKDDRERLAVYMSPELKQKVEALAKADKRTASGYVEVLLEKHVEEREKAEA